LVAGTDGALYRDVNEIAEQLRQRAKSFAVRVVAFVRVLPRDAAAAVVANQLAKSGSAVSANYHATCRARSRKEFIAKLGTVVEEADETEHWLDVLEQTQIASGEELRWLRDESRQLRAIFKASLDTARANFERDQGTKS
jgi:four helix bundle protein